MKNLTDQLAEALQMFMSNIDSPERYGMAQKSLQDYEAIKASDKKQHPGVLNFFSVNHLLEEKDRRILELEKESYSSEPPYYLKWKEQSLQIERMRNTLNEVRKFFNFMITESQIINYDVQDEINKILSET